MFSEETAAAIGEWLALRQAPDSIPWLFLGIGGKEPGSRMTPDGLRAIFRQIGKRVGFHFSPHDFRRSMAVMQISAGAPSKVVMLAGRWQSLAQVDRYTQALDVDAVRAYLPVPRLADAARTGGPDGHR